MASIASSSREETSRGIPLYPRTLTTNASSTRDINEYNSLEGLPPSFAHVEDFVQQRMKRAPLKSNRSASTHNSVPGDGGEKNNSNIHQYRKCCTICRDPNEVKQVSTTRHSLRPSSRQRSATNDSKVVITDAKQETGNPSSSCTCRNTCPVHKSSLSEQLKTLEAQRNNLQTALSLAQAEHIADNSRSNLLKKVMEAQQDALQYFIRLNRNYLKIDLSDVERKPSKRLSEKDKASIETIYIKKLTGKKSSLKKDAYVQTELSSCGAANLHQLCNSSALDPMSDQYFEPFNSNSVVESASWYRGCQKSLQMDSVSSKILVAHRYTTNRDESKLNGLQASTEGRSEEDCDLMRIITCQAIAMERDLKLLGHIA